MTEPGLLRVFFQLRDPESLMFRLALRIGNQNLLRFLVRNPTTFNQQVRRKMVYDRNPLLIQLADKIASKDYITSLLGEGYTPRTLAVASKSTEIDVASLPLNYAVKVSHASGGVILVSDTFSRSDSLPADPNDLARLQIKSDDADFYQFAPLLDYWLGLEYGGKKGEWAYTQIQPRIIVEEYLRSDAEFPPPDLKFFVFDGKCHAIRFDQYQAGGKFRFHFDRQGNYIPVAFAEFGKPYFPVGTEVPPLPQHFKEMRSLAERLGTGLDFVRVDMYELDGRILVGELTLYPTSGTALFRPRSFDRWLGSAWPK